MTDEIRKELNDMLERVTQEKLIANQVYVDIWKHIISKYYALIAYSHQFDLDSIISVDYKTNEKIDMICKNSNISKAMILNILFRMVEKDGIKYELCYNGTCYNFQITVGKINTFVTSSQENENSISKL